jgi:hypothetical protein
MKKTSLVPLALAGLFVLFAVPSGATSLIENFTKNPSLDGWQIFGDTNLFQWDSTNQTLAVTWDSSQTNSYFYHSLGATFTKADSFCVLFDLNLTNVNVTGYFELAVGLCNFAGATSNNFSRANGISPNLFEFDYFPDGGYGPSIDATLFDANDNFYYAYDDSQPLASGVTYQILLVHRAGESSISGTVFTNGQVFSTLPQIASDGADDFRLDTICISSYTTTDDFYGDSLLAHGTVDKLAFASPLPISAVNIISARKIQFASDANWLYTLEQSSDLHNWSSAATAIFGSGTNLVLQATNLPPDKMFYRVRADLP